MVAATIADACNQFFAGWQPGDMSWESGVVKCFLVNVKMKLNMQNWYIYTYQTAVLGQFSVYLHNVICKNVSWV